MHFTLRRSQTIDAQAVAEISSRFTNAGGLYAWTGALSGRMGKLPAFCVGVVYSIVAIAGIAAVSLQAVQMAVSIRQIQARCDEALRRARAAESDWAND